MKCDENIQIKLIVNLAIATNNFRSLISVLLTLASSSFSIGDASSLDNPTTIDSALLARAKELLNTIDQERSQWKNEVSLARWDYKSNLTDGNYLKLLNSSAQFANYSGQMTTEINDFPWHDIEDYNLKRQFERLSVPGSAALPKDEYSEYKAIVSRMVKIYATAKICDFRNSSNCNLALEPELTEILMKSRNPHELEYVWKAWRDASGKKVKDDFIRYVELNNEIAKLNNYADMAAFWMKSYEADDFTEQIAVLWQQLKPLYLEIHAYVRHALRRKYGKTVISKDGPIPAHLFGNM